ncbi:MAG: metallophosphoesterase family protein [Acidobacteriota bacterium]
MRYLVLSDLHANLEATRAVLDDARRLGFDETVILGDLVGYGAEPNEVIELVRRLEPMHAVRGNHDKAASGITNAETFHDVAREAVMWTRERLTGENRRFLHGLTEGPADLGKFWIAHGSPLDEEEYILQAADAHETFSQLDLALAFFGHTHFTSVFRLEGGAVSMALVRGDDELVRLDRKCRYLVNPGSIGQPRDCNPKASYAILDTRRETIRVRRVAYDIAGAQAKIRKAGLPPVLAYRLAQGV